MFNGVRFRRTRRALTLAAFLLPAALILLPSAGGAAPASARGPRPRAPPAQRPPLPLRPAGRAPPPVVTAEDDAALDARDGRLVEASDTNGAVATFLVTPRAKSLRSPAEQRGARLASRVGAALAPFQGVAIERLIPVARPVLDLLRRA